NRSGCFTSNQVQSLGILVWVFFCLQGKILRDWHFGSSNRTPPLLEMPHRRGLPGRWGICLAARPQRPFSLQRPLIWPLTERVPAPVGVQAVEAVRGVAAEDGVTHG